MSFREYGGLIKPSEVQDLHIQKQILGGGGIM